MRRLLIRPGGIGDCLLCFPALEHLRADYTEVWVPTAVVPLISFADRVRSLAATGLDRVGLGNDESVLARLKHFDEIVSWYGTNRPEFREILEGLGVSCRFHEALPPATSPDHATDFFCRQVGAPLNQRPVLPWGQSPKTQAAPLPPPGQATPQTQGLQTQGLSLKTQGAPLPLPILQTSEIRGLSPFSGPSNTEIRGLSPFFQGGTLDQRGTIVIHPFSGGSKKNWPLWKFQEVAAYLGKPVEWSAGPEEELAEAHRFEDLAALSRWLTGATLYIGNDSGISHLAAANGVPTLVLFGESNAKIWAPRGPNVTVIEHHPLQDLAIQTVLDAARVLLPPS